MTKIHVDVHPWLDEKGVISSLYLGNGCEPTHEEITPYEHLIDQALESYTVRDVLRDIDYADAEAFVKALEAAATYARTRLNELSE
jgi:hypothetical protein